MLGIEVGPEKIRSKLQFRNVAPVSQAFVVNCHLRHLLVCTCTHHYTSVTSTKTKLFFTVVLILLTVVSVHFLYMVNEIAISSPPVKSHHNWKWNVEPVKTEKKNAENAVLTLTLFLV